MSLLLVRRFCGLMIFTSYWFIFFAGVFLPIFWMLPRVELRLSLLAVACLIFHAHFAGAAGMAPIVVLMIVAYAAGYSGRGRACGVGMVICVLALLFYKYAFFLIHAIVAPWDAGLAESLRADAGKAMPGAPPLGVSFFVFEFVHYLYEIKKGGAPIRNPLKFLLFSIFFPSLVAGPIKRYAQFIPALESGSRRVTGDDVAEGFRRIALGYAKKVILADNLTVYIDLYQPQFGTLDLGHRWIVLAAIALRILWDFSGYSDIAIGFARLLGVALPENFNWPYMARNLQDFWQRWHISLSSWIRDYVYIPLGGNRHGALRKVMNGLIAFALCGLWHGPAWNFVLWGLYHGIGLMLCVIYRKIPGVGLVIDALMRKEPLTGLVLTQLYVWFGWLLFFYPVQTAWDMTLRLFAQ